MLFVHWIPVSEELNGVVLPKRRLSPISHERCPTVPTVGAASGLTRWDSDALRLVSGLCRRGAGSSGRSINSSQPIWVSAGPKPAKKKTTGPFAGQASLKGSCRGGRWWPLVTVSMQEDKVNGKSGKLRAAGSVPDMVSVT